jgi:CheY-like chemotaxis protein
MDFQMPLVDGIGATKRLRTLGINIPIVGLTANADEVARRDGLDAGMNAILGKPIKGQKLKAAIEAVCIEVQAEKDKSLS